MSSLNATEWEPYFCLLLSRSEIDTWGVIILLRFLLVNRANQEVTRFSVDPQDFHDGRHRSLQLNSRTVSESQMRY